MRHFRSLTRLLIFYASTLTIMLVLYYVMMISTLKSNSQEHSQIVFDALRYEMTKNTTVTDFEVKEVLNNPILKGISYQIILMLPSGQSYVHRYTRPQEQAFVTVVFPSLNASSDLDKSEYQLTNDTLSGVITLKAGHQIYVVLRHKPIEINWLSYAYWLPLMIAIALFAIVILYMSKRRLDWLQLLKYIEDLTITAKDAYTLSPFAERPSSPEFLRLGHALGRVSYQLHSNYRRIKNLSHRLERLVDQAPLPMLMIMRQGQISFFNQRFEQVFTTSFQRGTDYSLTDFITGSDKSTQQVLQKLSTQRVTRTLLVYGLENKQAYQLHITPWFGEHGQVHGFTVLLNNVDSLIKQSAAMQIKNQHLESQIKEFTQLRSIIGHELRTPLSAIIGTLDLIEYSNFSTDQMDTLSTLKQSSYSMLAMLNDMLDVAKIEAGKAQIVNEPTDIFKVGQHITDLMAGSARQQNLELLYLFMPECPRYITTDINRLQQILLNLINNAIKFTSTGYVALIVEPITQRRIKSVASYSRANFSYRGNALSPSKDPLAVSNSGTFRRLNEDLAKQVTPLINQSDSTMEHHWIRFSIKDTGIGIIEADQHKLFSYFNQANAKVSHKFGGTGLGLAISNSFAQLLGGFIQIDSDGVSGSTFALYLPCRAPTYQSAYPFNAEMTPIYLIAIVKHDICIDYLQRLCQHLSIDADIYTIDAAPEIDQLSEKLQYKKRAFAPVLILDHEDYSSYKYPKSYAVSTDVEADKSLSTFEDNDSEAIYPNIGRLLCLNIPKVLLSMKPERTIPSAYLDHFDGFLTKPIDVTLLLADLVRLTQPKPLANADSLIVPASISINQNLTEQLLAVDETSIHDSEIEYLGTQDKQTVPLILVVEDNLINQKITCKLLDRLGYRSVVAHNGQQALEQLTVTDQNISLILMDCRMPVMDGMQATRAIRSNGNNIPIIALTVNNSIEDQEICTAAGMDDFLIKPINKNHLTSLLQRFIADE